MGKNIMINGFIVLLDGVPHLDTLSDTAFGAKNRFSESTCLDLPASALSDWRSKALEDEWTKWGNRVKVHAVKIKIGSPI